jgi:cytochrome c2
MIRVLVLVSSILFFNIASAKDNSLTLDAEEKSDTIYTGISVKKYIFAFGSYGGGAIARDGKYLLYATMDGRFFRINPETLQVSEEALPHLELNINKRLKSKRITYVETEPRVHDVENINGEYFVSYDFYDESADGIRFQISRYNKKIGLWEKIYATDILDTPTLTLGTGGRIIAFGDDSILFSVGDYMLDRKNGLPSDFAPQNLNFPWGKTIKLRLPDLTSSIYSFGHRNPEGLLLLPDGSILASEHGPRGGDKLNLIIEGKNYGWPFFSYGVNYNTYKKIDTQDTQKNEFTSPIYSFVPSIAPTQLIQVSPEIAPWSGNILLGSLKAQSIFNIKLEKSATESDPAKQYRVAFVEPIFIGTRIRDLIELHGKIWGLGDNGTLISIEILGPSFLPADGSYQKLVRCWVCHPVGGKSDQFAPSILHVFGRSIGGAEDFINYSSDFRSLNSTGAKWNLDTLAGFIESPQSLAANTNMPNLHLTSEQSLEIAKALAELK